MGDVLSFDIIMAIALTASFAAIALVILYLGAPIADKRKVIENLSTLSQYDEHTQLRDIVLLDSFFDRIMQKYLLKVAQWLFRHTPSGIWKIYEDRLVCAGNPRDMNADMFLAIKVLTMSTFSVIAILASIVGIVPWQYLILLLLVMGIMGFFIPDLFIKAIIDQRRKDVRLSLPDMLDLLTISVEAGLGFDGALNKLTQNTKGVLSEEFIKVLQEMRMGAPRSQAMRNLSNRVDVPELRSFISAIIQAEVFGTSIGNVLRTQSKDLRLRRRQKAEEIAQKAPVKMVFPLIVCILPSLFTVILGPAIINIYNAIILGVFSS